jgi:hypothetical protein
MQALWGNKGLDSEEMWGSIKFRWGEKTWQILLRSIYQKIYEKLSGYYSDTSKVAWDKTPANLHILKKSWGPDRE